LMESGIPVWIRNTFTPERSGTKITRTGPVGGNGARALTAISDAAMITLGGPCLAGAPEVLSRTLTATSAVRADVLLVSQSSAQNEVCLIVPAAHAKRTVEALRHEFAQELAHQQAEHVKLDSEVAIVTVVGQDIRRVPGTVGRLFGALGKKNINVMAIAQGSSDCKLSYVVEKAELKAALVATHQEFQFEAMKLRTVPIGQTAEPAAWYYEPQQPRADAD
jgi:bifunctional aspartokinase / homoserine dehydrogenase 1